MACIKVKEIADENLQLNLNPNFNKVKPPILMNRAISPTIESSNRQLT